MCNPDFLSIVSIALSAVAAGFSIWSFFAERNRTRSEATIHAFDELSKNIFDKSDTDLDTISQEDAKKFVQQHTSEGQDEEQKRQWDDITKKLALLEHFCVGINLKTYDKKALNAMAGNLMLKLWENLKPIIEYKRSKDNGKANYAEFEKAVDKLQSLRSKGKPA